MTLPEPFYAFEQHAAIDLDGARVLFTTRRGGFSSGPYESLNLGRLTEDRPEDVARNRGLLQDKVGAQLAHIRQVHGTDVRRITERPNGSGELPLFDGQATALPGVAPIVLTADCGDRAWRRAVLLRGRRGCPRRVRRAGARPP